MTQGLRQQYWKPATGSLLDQTLPYSSAAFDAFKGQMIFLPDLTNPGIGVMGRGAFGVMFYGLGATGAGLYKEPAGKTIDQFVASTLPLPLSGRPSLNLGVQLDRPPRTTTMPGGNFCYWAGAGQPIRAVGDPYAVYRELFGSPNVTDVAAVRRLLVRRKSILDYVGSNLEDFQSRAGTEDRQAIGAHLQSIRDLELRIQAAPDTASCGPAPLRAMVDVNDNANYPFVLDAHLRLMVAALKCGVTNVTTLQTSDAGGRSIDFGAFVPGLPPMSSGYKSALRNWYDLAHNPVQGGVDHKRIVERWFFDRFAAMLAQMRSVPEEGGTMLDNTVVIIGNCMQEGDNRDSQKMPWMLAGNCGGYFNSGNCLPSAGHPIASVMAGICEAMDLKHPYGEVLPGLKRP
jgi:hypothetical protein